jgi:hypothetical protein
MTIEGVPRTDITKEKWDALVQGSPDGFVWGVFDWQEMITQVPGWGLRDVSFALVERSDLRAVVPVHHITAETRVSSGGWGLIGPIVAGDLPDKHARRVRASAIEHIGRIAADLRCTRIDVGTPTVTQSALNNRWGVNPFLEFGFTDCSSHSRVVDLTRSEEELMSAVSESTRRQIRRAAQLGYTARVEPWSEHVDSYHELHTATYARTGAIRIAREYFAGIADRIAPLGLSRLLVARDADGRVVAYHNQACFREAAFYHTGCSATDHLGSGVNHLLFWSSMLDARAQGRKWYEVGEVFFSYGSEKDRGLTEYKTRFGGDTHRTFRARMELSNHKGKASLAGWLRVARSYVTNRGSA